ncbi:MAG: ATP synthase F1 subunit gamma [Bacteroidales bacterium]|jgi:F-type H+-transporting ATPase subunit gamma|nr:ATP synthase F1 subunit gamma [Bacteroidales bacterium]
MASLKELKNRISSISTTKQITSAMKMISAAKLKRGQDKIVQIRPYSNKFTEILQEVSSNLDKNISSIYTETRNPEKVLIVLLASNRGLCGAFNNNICKIAIKHIEDNYSTQIQNNNVKFFCIGKKADDFIKKLKYEIIKNGDEILDDLTFEKTTEYAEFLMKNFVNGTYDKIEIIYNSFVNATVYNQTIEQFLPVSLSNNDNTEKNAKSDYIFEPSVEKIIEEMVPKSLKIQLHKIILDSFVAEQGARTTAMHQATDNATELIKESTLMYNKARQAAITNELIEITSGAECLK